ncbi:hypothetical protein TNCV_1413081, partial [Trichonephila clavipes]
QIMRAALCQRRRSSVKQNSSPSDKSAGAGIRTRDLRKPQSNASANSAIGTL